MPFFLGNPKPFQKFLSLNPESILTIFLQTQGHSTVLYAKSHNAPPTPANNITTPDIRAFPPEPGAVARSPSSGNVSPAGEASTGTETGESVGDLVVGLSLEGGSVGIAVMGCFEGESVGVPVGVFDGLPVGFIVGAGVLGLEVGAKVTVGNSDGVLVGAIEVLGTSVGDEEIVGAVVMVGEVVGVKEMLGAEVVVGEVDGRSVGEEEGRSEGDWVGEVVGEVVGLRVGFFVGVVVGLEEILGSLDGVSVGVEVGIDETVGGAETLGRIVGATELVGLVETVGMVVVVGAALGSMLNVGARVGLPVGCNPGKHVYLLPAGCPSQQVEIAHFSILSSNA